MSHLGLEEAGGGEEAVGHLAGGGELSPQEGRCPYGVGIDQEQQAGGPERGQLEACFALRPSSLGPEWAVLTCLWL